MNPSPGSWRGGFGWPGDGVVATGEALIATIRHNRTFCRHYRRHVPPPPCVPDSAIRRWEKNLSDYVP
jgi:hypothetical protein